MLRRQICSRWSRITLPLFWVLTILLIPLVATAAEDCAGTPQQLIQYLNKSATQTVPYKIKVLAGTYILPAGMYVGAAATAPLTIEGGYLDCSSRGPNDPSKTII